jgi:hypothetical protein
MRNWTFIIVLCIASRAAADQAANGRNGVNAQVTGLTGGGGRGVIGQVEDRRPGKALYDSNSNSASNTFPAGVFFQTSGGQDAANSLNIGNHPTGVAGVMIGQNGSLTGRTDTDVSYPLYEGVAQGALLYADAAGDFDEVDLVESINRMAKISGGGVQALNMSFDIPISFPESPNGNSYLTLFLDWSARQHDILYVGSWGNTLSAANRSPADMFNGLVVGASMQPSSDNFWRKFATDVNSADGLGDTGTETMHIDLLAPGKNIHVLETNDSAHTNAAGTSYSAPLVTGSVALLQDFVRTPHPGNFTNATKHQVMKAVMMNSADKLAGVQGAYRTAIDQNDLDWTQSEAFNDPATPLDDQMGTGLLNVQRAITQLEPGRFGPGAPVPLIGWDYGLTPAPAQSIEYFFNQPLGGGQYITITLAYDRPVFCSCFDDYVTGSAFQPSTFPDIDLFLEQIDGTIIASSTSKNLSVEHIFSTNLPAGSYKIVVTHNFDDTGESTNYGLAWWYGPPPVIAGDYNNDGKVDGADYVLWRKDPASYGGDPGGYDTWRANFGTGSGSGASLASVPEPSSAMLLVVVSILCGAAIRRRA